MINEKTDNNDQDIQLDQPDSQEHDVESTAPSETIRIETPRKSPEDELVVLKRERDELEAKLLRTAADYQNFARRSQQNISSAAEQQLMSMARDLLTIMDHFDHAMNIDVEKTTMAGLLEGIQIVRDEMIKTLERFGVKRMNVSVGDEFDPSRHEAMMHQRVETLNSNQIAIELQTGYTLGDMTLRPAKVSVAE